MRFFLTILFIPFFCLSENLNVDLIKAFGFGSNALGSLGIGKSWIFDNPVEAFGLKNVVKISAGSEHTLVLLSDGTVWSFGNNSSGQLGDETFIDSAYPVQVLKWDHGFFPLTNVIDISAGSYHSVALTEDGNVWTWGENFDGQLGRTCSCPDTFARKIEWTSEFKFIKAVDAGLLYTLALKYDGTVWGWGTNYAGQLTDDYSIQEVDAPIKIEGLKDIIAISAGAVHSLALKKDGTVLAWGINLNGELGDGTHNNSTKPVKVKNLTNVKEISAGIFFSVALKEDGTVWVWGDNYYGTLGDGTMQNDIDTPKKVEGLPKIMHISANYYSVMALDTSGNVWTWGYGVGYANENGSYDIITRPIKIKDLNNVSSISQGEEHQIFIKEDGSLWGRGNNYYGQLGIGEFGYEPYPKAINTINDLVQVSGGYLFSAGLSKDGSVWTWGYNYYGQLGNGKTKDEMLYSLAPVKVLNLENVIQISAGFEFGLALKNDGTVWAWGHNSSGELGNGTYNDSNIPVKVLNLNDVIKIDAEWNAIALKSDGTVWTWGLLSKTNLPKKVPNLEGIIDISAGQHHFLALKNDGTVWAWGANDGCQLGIGNSSYYGYDVPFKVKDLSNIISISAGAEHSLALRDDGKVFVWGYGGKWFYDEYSGCFGHFAKMVCTPEEMEGLPPISKVYAGYYSSIVVDKDGYLWGWGYNGDAQLGLGERYYAQVEPKKIEGIRNPISVGMGTFHTLVIGEYDLKIKLPLR